MSNLGIWMVVICVLAACAGCSSRRVSDSPERGEVVRDRIWIWAHQAGAHNNYWLKNLPRKSSIGPVEAAEYMGIGNIIMVRYEGKPAPPFDRHYEPFRRMEKVIWSLAGMGGITSAAERREVLKLAANEPNIVGFVLDDFFCGGAFPTPPVHWLAEVSVKFPVVLTITPPNKLTCDKLELTQSAWPEGSYRTKDFAVDISPDGEAWQEVFTGAIPNKPGEKLAVKLPGRELAALRIRVLSTHDTKGGMSCGLKRVRLWSNGRPMDTSKWQARASSAYGTFTPDNLLVDENDVPLPAALTPQQLAGIRKQLVIRGKRLPLTAVLYDKQITPRALHHLKHVDWILFWTWLAKDLKDLEKNFAKLEKLNAGKSILLGCYMFDYGTCKPMSPELMKMQAELGLKWLKAGRIDGIIFLGTPICDLDLPAVEWTRKWIAKVGGQKLTVKPASTK